MDETERASLTWIKAQASTHNGACVELCKTGDKQGAIRDSKDPDGPILISEGFKEFLNAARNGEFDDILAEAEEKNQP